MKADRRRARQEELGFWGLAWRRMRRDPMALAGMAVVLALVLVAWLAPLLANNKPIAMRWQGGTVYPALAETFPFRFFLDYPGLRLVDYEKMARMGNYFDASCLKFDDAQDLFIEKAGKLFHWWVNAFTDWPTAPHYKKLVAEVEAMDRATWDRRKADLVKLDRELSEEFLQKDLTHYSLRYAHVMGVHSDFIKWEREKLARDKNAQKVTYTLD